jgi:transmembrane sensor
MSREPDIDEGQRVAEEAAEWLVRLDARECSATELEDFERWRSADPMHAVAYRQAQAMWRDSNASIRNSMALSDAARRALREPPERRVAHRWWLAAGAAVAAAIVIVAFLHWPFTSAEPPAGTRYATTVGEQRDVTLSDGSRLTLDTQTVLVERYSPRVRQIDLLQGRAQFQVHSNPSRPFVVHVGDGTVTAVGTRFQVRVAGTGATGVTLLKGEVRVAARERDGVERAVSLQAGQSLRIGADGTLGDVQAADLRVAQGWTEGELYVDNWRLQDFITEFNRYSNVQFRIDDPALRNVRISGVFQTRNRDRLEQLLAQGWDIRSRQVASNEILLTRQ